MYLKHKLHARQNQFLMKGKYSKCFNHAMCGLAATHNMTTAPNHNLLKGNKRIWNWQVTNNFTAFWKRKLKVFFFQYIWNHTKCNIHCIIWSLYQPSQLQGGGGGVLVTCRGVGGGVSQKKFFWPVGPQFGPKIRGDPGPPDPFPGPATKLFDDG